GARYVEIRSRRSHTYLRLLYTQDTSWPEKHTTCAFSTIDHLLTNIIPVTSVAISSLYHGHNPS
nr:hypothetical protein [Tanacetum cinerariifolium]